MRPLAAFVLALSLSACHGCATTPAPDGGTVTPSPVGTFGHCSTQALVTASQGILGDVTTALATGDYVGELAKLAATYGAAEAGCAVNIVIAEFKAKAARSDDTQVAVVLVHAQAWRMANP